MRGYIHSFQPTNIWDFGLPPNHEYLGTGSQGADIFSFGCNCFIFYANFMPELGDSLENSYFRQHKVVRECCDVGFDMPRLFISLRAEIMYEPFVRLLQRNCVL